MNDKYIDFICDKLEINSDYLINNKDECVKALQNIVGEEKYAYMYAFSKIWSSSQIYETILNEIYHDYHLTWNKKHFLLGLVIGELFKKSSIVTHEIRKKEFKIYAQIREEYALDLGGYKFINDRTKNLIFITIQQFLGIKHAPSKTLLDRAFILKSELNKDVIIINTAELLGGTVTAYMNNTSYYNNELTEAEVFTYEGVKFPYVQFEHDTPNVESGRMLCDFVKKYKPEYIVNIGNYSLMVEQCASIVPVLNIGTVPSQIAMSAATMQAVGENVEIGTQEKELLSILGKKPKDVISGRFTSSIPNKQEHKFSRNMLEIPEDAFVIVIIGARLTEEMTYDFNCMLNDIMSDKVRIVIIGRMNNYNELVEKYDNFRKYSVYLGMQSDVLAILDLCDLYVNPPRRGGGTSVIEAMYKGLPVVSFNFGDVSLGCGKDFCVNNMEDMKKEIIRYSTDKAYYDKKAKMAIERADYMLDSKTAFCQIIDEFEKKIYENNNT